MGKVTMQQIADALSTSRISVWKALNNRPGISQELRQQVWDMSRKLGYAKTEEAAEAVKPAAALTVSVVVARPESSVFWMKIIHQIAKELSHNNINLMYTYIPSSYKSGYTLPSNLYDQSIAGVIVLNCYSENILRMLARLRMPKVFLDTVPAVPPGELDGDLVYIEGRTLVREITGRIIQSGRRKIGFVGDIEYAQTNLDRYLGFLDALAAGGLKPDPRLCLTGKLGLHTHYEEISRFLEGLAEMPDAFVCVSDYIAHFIQQYIDEHPTPANKNVLLTGFDNSDEYLNVAGRITTVNVQTHRMGDRLARKIMFDIEHPDSSPEVSYVVSDILYRGALKTDSE